MQISVFSPIKVTTKIPIFMQISIKGKYVMFGLVLDYVRKTFAHKCFMCTSEVLPPKAKLNETVRGFLVSSVV